MFNGEAGGIAGVGTVVTDNTVAGDDEGDRILTDHSSNGLR